MKKVFYVAHPVSGDPKGNVDKVIVWIRWLTMNEPHSVYIAPWVAEVIAFADQDIEMGSAFYDRVVSDDEDVVGKLDGILLVGGRVTPGMARERAVARAKNLIVVDASHLTEPPTGLKATEQLLAALQWHS